MESGKEDLGGSTAERVPSSDYEPQKAGLGARAKRHCARWWWLHLLIFAVIVLVVVLPLIYVGVPHMAQSDIDDSTLDVNVQNVTETETDLIKLDLVTVARSSSSYHPDLDAFNASLFLEDTEPNIAPFGYITIPPAKAASEFEIVVSQMMDVVDAEQFKAYNVLVMLSEEFRVAIRGRMGLHLSGLPKYTVNYNKVVTMKGLNRLHGFDIENIQIKLKAEDDGTNLIGNVLIPNPSVLTLEMGNVTMDLSVDGKPIGYSILPDFTLYPGLNNHTMRSVTNQSLVLAMLSSTYTDGILPVDIVGNSSVRNGQHLPYFEAAIQSNPLRVNLDVGAALADIGLNLTKV